jgi:hypothetical protein
MIYHTQAVTPVTPDDVKQQSINHSLHGYTRKKENTRLFVCLFDAA